MLYLTSECVSVIEFSLPMRIDITYLPVFTGRDEFHELIYSIPAPMETKNVITFGFRNPVISTLLNTTDQSLIKVPVIKQDIRKF